MIKSFNSARSALVLGAGGFIGRHVCSQLARHSYTVHGLGHGHWGKTEWQSWGLSTWTISDVSLDSMSDALTKHQPTVVLYCAGSGAVSSAFQQPFEDFNRSVATVAAVLEAIRTSAIPTRLVLTSSAAVYGDQGEVDLTESAVRAPVSPYGFHKAAAESICDSYSRFFGLNVSIVRLFSVYGAGLRKQLLWDACNKFAAGQSRFFGTGNELRDWIHVNDAAELLCAAAMRSQQPLEIYNGGHSKRTTQQILALLAGDVTPRMKPEFTGETHSGNPRRLTSDSSRATAHLGWTPTTTIEDGLRAYAAWFKSAR